MLPRSDSSSDALSVVTVPPLSTSTRKPRRRLSSGSAMYTFSPAASTTWPSSASMRASGSAARCAGVSGESIVASTSAPTRTFGAASSTRPFFAASRRAPRATVMSPVARPA